MGEDSDGAWNIRREGGWSHHSSQSQPRPELYSPSRLDRINVMSHFFYRFGICKRNARAASSRGGRPILHGTPTIHEDMYFFVSRKYSIIKLDSHGVEPGILNPYAKRVSHSQSQLSVTTLYLDSKHWIIIKGELGLNSRTLTSQLRTRYLSPGEPLPCICTTVAALAGGGSPAYFLFGWTKLLEADTGGRLRRCLLLFSCAKTHWLFPRGRDNTACLTPYGQLRSRTFFICCLLFPPP